jgi:hypothetical protein
VIRKRELLGGFTRVETISRIYGLICMETYSSLNKAVLKLTTSIRIQMANFDPFGAAFTNQITLGMGNGSGSLVTYDLFAEFQETVGLMFGLHILFTWNHVTKKLSIARKMTAPETVALQVYMTRPEEELLQDQYARPWLREYTLARCKFMLGESRSKFGNLPGPTGGGSLNGDAMKQEAVAMMEKLDLEINTQVDSAVAYGFVIG